MAKFTRTEIRAILGEACTDEIENKLVALHLGVIDPLKDDLQKYKAGYTDAEIAEMEASLAKLKTLYAQGQSDARAAGAAQALALAEGFQNNSNHIIQVVGNAIASAFGAGNSTPVGSNIMTRSIVSVGGAPVAQANNSPYQITINVNAQTTDLAKTIAAEIQNVLNKALNANGTAYKNGRTRYA